MKLTLAPPDQLHRDAILGDLGSTILVEAAAGTGKTTSIVGRMARLLAEGVATAERMAALTFTRKAAAELADRFHKVLQAEASQSVSQEKARLERAILSLDRCFIGTIHSFCGRLLRERPLEAGLPLDFEEIDEQEDQRIRAQVWERFVEATYGSQDPILQRLEDLGLQLEDLATSFQAICDYEDVEEWPAEEIVMPDLEPAVMELEAMVDHMEPLVRDFPEHSSKDDLITVYERVVLAYRQAAHIRSTPQLMDVLSQFKAVKSAPRSWPWGSKHAKAEQERLNDFIQKVAAPLLKQWREYRYAAVMEALLSALNQYRCKKLELCKLNFQDLLLYSARMLQKKPSVRRYFRKKYTHILVDEFQDTDPIQAEVLFYLTADDPCETDWKKCRPAPGSLFVVGDPKQSIYRFRRADIITYNEVKRIVAETGGKIVTLSANFRTVGPLIDWVNGFFPTRFAEQPQGTSPSYVALQKVIPEPKRGSLYGVRVLRVSPDKDGQRSTVEVDAQSIGSIIRSLLDEKTEIPITPYNHSAAAYRTVEPGDFLVITPRLKHLHLYAKALQDLDIPYEVTGSATVNESEQVSILLSVISSLVEPHNPLHLLAVLRGPMFGLSDQQLYDFKTKGGIFSFESDAPKDLDPFTARIFSDAFARMQRYRSWLLRLPMIPALEKIVEDLGLMIHAAVDTGGNLKVGAIYKALEWLRKSSPHLLTANDLRQALQALVAKTQTHDAIPAMTIRGSAVRLMNLHKVKGLEAPIVFLADPSGSLEKPPLIHIDRSGSKVRGYFAIHSVQARGSNPMIFAQPVDWDHYAQRESDFQRAEFLRLLYVAATRAGCLLTISQLDKSKRRHPWVMFSDSLDESPEWSGPFQKERRRVIVEENIAGDEALRVRAELLQKWECVTSPSYQSSGVKARTVVSEDIPIAARDHGTRLGIAIHALLERAMLHEDIDLKQAACSILSEVGLEMELLPSCIDAVKRVMSSELWTRARQSPRVLVETPFQTLFSDAESDSSGVPLILRGVIDLIFQEDGAWVLVDYKTDRIPEGSLTRLVDKYRNQVLAYAHAWAGITGQGVKEKGLYFTHLDRYIALDP